MNSAAHHVLCHVEGGHKRVVREVGRGLATLIPTRSRTRRDCVLAGRAPVKGCPASQHAILTASLLESMGLAALLHFQGGRGPVLRMHNTKYAAHYNNIFLIRNITMYQSEKTAYLSGSKSPLRDIPPQQESRTVYRRPVPLLYKKKEITRKKLYPFSLFLLIDKEPFCSIITSILTHIASRPKPCERL